MDPIGNQPHGFRGLSLGYNFISFIHLLNSDTNSFCVIYKFDILD